jgi:hypothetical protein
MTLPCGDFPCCCIIIPIGFGEHDCMKYMDFCAKEVEVKWKVKELSRSEM